MPVTPSNLVSHHMSQVTDTHIGNLHLLEELSGLRSHLTVFQLKFARSKKAKEAGEILRMKILTEIFFKERTGKTNKKTKNV